MGFLFGGQKTQGVTQPAISGVQFQTSVYGKCIPIVYGTNRIAPNVIWYGDFTATAAPSQSVGGKGGVVGGGGGGKGGGGSAGYTYTASFALGLCEGPIVGFGAAYVDKNVTTLSALGFTSFTGTYPQTPWSYLTTKYPGEALGYNGLAYMAGSGISLGNSANLSNYNVIVKGIYSNSVGSLTDADPSLVVTDWLTNAKYGVGFPSSYIGSLTTHQNYTLATGLLISPAWTTQQQASQMLSDIMANTNSAVVWSSGLLNIVPYGDASATGNGKTYTPPSSADYDLTDNDFIAPPGTDPVMCTRKRQSDQINSLKMEYQDASNNYNIEVVEVKDTAAIDLYGLRQDSSNNAHLFTNATSANTAAQLMLQRQSIRNVYTFTVDQRFILLDPMDIVTLTDSGLRLVQQWVRILTIDENDDYSLTMTAEEYLAGNGSAALYSFETGQGFSANYNESPGFANVPVVFEPPVQIATNTGLETWIATSGGALWGGCDIYISSDDVTYKYVGRVNGPARQGELTTVLPVGSDPDTMDTLTVDLTESLSILLSGTQDDADQGHTLCYVGGEMIAYQTATLTSAYKYSLTYLRRGMYGTTIASHSVGSDFARLDSQIFVYPYDLSQIGQTIYIKLCGFNLYGGGTQSLADVTAYAHVIQGPPVPPDVENFYAKQVGDTVAFKWDQVQDFALKGYDIGYAVQGSTDWADFTILTEAAKGTEMTNASVPFGTWTFGIRAVDIADQLSANIGTFDLEVINTGNLLYLQENAPDWELGTLSGFVKHWTGILIPDNQFTPSHYSSYQDFDTFVVDPVSSGSFTSPTIDIGYNDNVRVFGTITAATGPGMVNAPTTATLLDHWQQGSTDPNVYTVWGNEFATMRYAKMRFTVTGITSTNANYYSQFDVEIDKAENTTQSGSATISSGGTTISYGLPFHSPPFVTGTAVSTAAAYVTASAITSSDAVLHVWSSSGASTSALVNWQAIGE